MEHPIAPALPAIDLAPGEQYVAFVNGDACPACTRRYTPVWWGADGGYRWACFCPYRGRQVRLEMPAGDYPPLRLIYGLTGPRGRELTRPCLLYRAGDGCPACEAARSPHARPAEQTAFGYNTGLLGADCPALQLAGQAPAGVLRVRPLKPPERLPAVRGRRAAFTADGTAAADARWTAAEPAGLSCDTCRLRWDYTSPHPMNGGRAAERAHALGGGRLKA
jgi:hypothetical protein